MTEKLHTVILPSVSHIQQMVVLVGKTYVAQKHHVTVMRP